MDNLTPAPPTALASQAPVLGGKVAGAMPSLLGEEATLPGGPLHCCKEPRRRTAGKRPPLALQEHRGEPVPLRQHINQ